MLVSSVADKSGTYNGVEVKAGDHIGVIDDDIIVCAANDPVTALVELTKHIPGIKDVDLAMQAGYSTASENVRALGFGAGMGLPNMKKYSEGSVTSRMQ